MAKISYTKTSFTGGELGSSLWGRVDVSQYDNACAYLENFLVRPYGPVISSPGTEFIYESKISAAGSDSTVRIIPFVFSKNDAYIIEIGEGYFRFYADGGIVVTTGTTVYEISHNYTADEIMDIQFTQMNDIIFMVHPDHKPAKLTRLGAANWTFEDFDIKGGPFRAENSTDTTLSPSDSTGTINIIASPVDSNVFVPSSSTTKGHHGAYFKIGGTRTAATTLVEEQGYVEITYVTNSYTATASVIKQLTITGATTWWAEGAFSEVRGYPAAVALHEGRLVLARTDSDPQGVWTSRTYVYNDFMATSEDDSGLAYDLYSSESNDIKWLASKRDALLAGTFGGEFSITSSENLPLTPDNSAARNETSYGSEPIQPKKIGSILYYVQRFGKKIRELMFNWDENVYKSGDMNILSPEITGDGVIDMAFQQSPESRLYCVKTDGTICVLTREVDHQVQGWSRLTTNGKYESIAVIPSRTEGYDEVWVVVKREINGSVKRYIERFKSPIPPSRQDMCFYVHSGLSYNAYEETEGINMSLSATSGTGVTLTVSSSYFSIDDVGSRVRAVDADGNILGELEITGYTSGTEITGNVKKDFDSLAYSSTEWGLSVSQISGLEHLEAEEVKVLADGGTAISPTVASGTITMDYNYFILHIGLGYNQNLRTLPFDVGSVRGSSQAKKQRISEIAFKINNSHRGFYVGYDENFLQRIEFRDPSTLMGTPEALYTGYITNHIFNGGYEYGATVYIRNSDPLPLEILGLTVILDTYDK